MQCLIGGVAEIPLPVKGAAEWERSRHSTGELPICTLFSDVCHRFHDISTDQYAEEIPQENILHRFLREVFSIVIFFRFFPEYLRQAEIASFIVLIDELLKKGILTQKSLVDTYKFRVFLWESHVVPNIE